MRVGIDASNIRAGGTTTHLIELLRAADPPQFGCDEVVVWGGTAVLNRIEDRPWLQKLSHPLLEQAANPYRDRRHLQRAFWQRFLFRRLLVEHRCDVLLVPGGMDNSGFHPMVTMSRNMLVFDRAEAARYGWSLPRLRLWLLQLLQSRSFRRADGMIFLTEYARSIVAPIAGVDPSKTTVVPHGVSYKFSLPPRRQRDISEYSAANPYRILYVSTVDMYKHQWHVAEAIVRLYAAGFPVTCDLVGPAYPAGLQRLTGKLNELGASAEVVRYVGAVPYDRLHELYAKADMKVFASSCENMPNILLEAMAAGLPIACARKGPMPEILRDAGVYFDPQNPTEIAAAIGELLRSPELRARNAAKGFELSQQYSWQRCAGETFGFLAQCARDYYRKPAAT